jgi:hypothetical protein
MLTLVMRAVGFAARPPVPGPAALAMTPVKSLPSSKSPTLAGAILPRAGRLARGGYDGVHGG